MRCQAPIVLFLPGMLALGPLLFAAAPAAGSPARLIAPGGSCLGLGAEIEEGAAARLEPCDGRAADQVWQMPARSFGGPIGLGGFCLDGAALRLVRCAAGGELSFWRHQPDGRLEAGDQLGLCLDARSLDAGSLDAGSLDAGGPDAGELRLAACSGSAAQVFDAEGHHAWSLKTAALPADFLPIASSSPAVVYGRDASGLLRSENGGRSFTKVAPGAAGAFAVSSFDERRLFTLSGSRLDLSPDGGRSWSTVAVLPPEAIGGSARIVPSRLAGERVYVHGGLALWASADRGATFTRRGPLPPGSGPGDTRLIDLGGGVLLFLRIGDCTGCGDNLVLWRSEDDGAGWRQVFATASRAGSAELLQAPAQPGVVYLSVGPLEAGAHDRLLRSEDGGLGFAPAGELPSMAGRLLVDRDLSDTLYLISHNLLWRSRDGGAGWQQLVSPLVFAAPVATDLDEHGSLFLRFSGLLADPFGGRRAVYFESRDGGTHFTGFDPLVPDATDDSPLPLVATGRPGWLYHRSGYRLQRSEDGGASWKSRGLLANARQLAADPHDPERLFARFPGVLARSDDGGASFQPLALAGTPSALAVFAEGERTVVMAAAGGGLFRSADGGAHWTAPSSPPPGEVLQLLADGAAVYAVTAGDLLYRSTDFGASFAPRGSAEPSLAAAGGLLAHALRGDPETIRISTDGGLHFTDSHPPDRIGEQGGIAIDELRQIYVSGETRVHRSANFGRTWQSFGRDLLAGSPSSAIAVDPFDGAKLYRSSRHGLETGRWDETAPLDLGPRFEARVRWRDHLGQTGEGRPQALTFDSGLFWIFDPARAEVAVKVLDGRAINGKFWVFLASLTDVELDLQVLDRVSGEKFDFHNPLGRLASFGYVEVFPASGRDPAAAPPLPAAGRLVAATPVVTLLDRFEVSIDWRAGGPDGAPQSGAGQGRRLGEQTAAFYFFEPANVEVIVNLLDGRPINGKYWVYSGSMSDVEYVVRIEDRQSGLVRTYANRAGQLASVGDTDAFE